MNERWEYRTERSDDALLTRLSREGWEPTIGTLMDEMYYPGAFRRVPAVVLRRALTAERVAEIEAERRASERERDEYERRRALLPWWKRIFA